MLPRRCLESPGHGAEGIVAGLPAQHVVELVEMVDVDRDDRVGLADLPAAPLEGSADQQAGDRIGRLLLGPGDGAGADEVGNREGGDPAEPLDHGDLGVSERPVPPLGEHHRPDRGTGVNGAGDPAWGGPRLGEGVVPGDRSQNEWIGAQETALPDGGGTSCCAVLTDDHHPVAFDPVHPGDHRGRCAGLEEFDDGAARGRHHRVDIPLSADPGHGLEDPVQAVALTGTSWAGAAPEASNLTGPATGGAAWRDAIAAPDQRAGGGDAGADRRDGHGECRSAAGRQAVRGEGPVAVCQEVCGHDSRCCHRQREGCRPGAP